MEAIPAWMQVMALVLGPTGGAWLGVKAALNGLRAGQADLRVGQKEIREDVLKLHDKIDDHSKRIAVLEVCLERYPDRLHPRGP